MSDLRKYITEQQQLDFRQVARKCWLFFASVTLLLCTHWTFTSLNRSNRPEEYLWCFARAFNILLGWYRILLFFSTTVGVNMSWSAVVRTVGLLKHDNATEVAKNGLKASALPRKMSKPVDPELGQAIVTRDLSLDVFVTCYMESLETVKNTVTAALQVNIPEGIYLITVYVLDDGRDAAKKQYFTECTEALRKAGDARRQLVYVESGRHGHAKAGNLNNGLELSSGDLVTTLDADMQPVPESMCMLVDALREESTSCIPRRPTAFIQIPQRYHDVPAGDPFSSRNLQWYERLLPATGAQGAAPFVGTGGIFWREYLLQGGGFVTGQVTEDVQTAARLHTLGFRSAWVPSVTGSAVGESPLTGSEFLAQRTRWTWGSYTMFVSQCPLTQPGYSLYQRMFWFSSVWGYLLYPLAQLLELIAVMWILTNTILGHAPNYNVFMYERGWLLLVLSFYCEWVLYVLCPNARSTWVMWTDLISNRWTESSMMYIYFYMLLPLAKVIVTGAPMNSMKFAKPFAAVKQSGGKHSENLFYYALISSFGAIYLMFGGAGMAFSLLHMPNGIPATFTLCFGLLLFNQGVRNIWFVVQCIVPPKQIDGGHGYAKASSLRYYWFRMLVDGSEFVGVIALWTIRHGNACGFGGGIRGIAKLFVQQAQSLLLGADSPLCTA